MWTNDLFAQALRLEKPWKITKVEFTDVQSAKVSRRGCVKQAEAKAKRSAQAHDYDATNNVLRRIMSGDDAGELNIYIDFERGSKFPYPADNGEAKNITTGEEVLLGVYDVKPMTWRHLNFWQYRTFIHAKVPRVGDKDHSPRVVSVPWAREQSGFTLLFESFIVALSRGMSVSHVADIVGENDTRLWRVIKHYVDKAKDKADYSQVKYIGVDETSKKGHKYITVFVNLETHKVLYVGDGKDQTTIQKFTEYFEGHKGDRNNISVVTTDMSLGFKSGILNNFPKATTIIDKFHVIKNVNDSVDQVRKTESKENILLKGTKYLWLMNEDNLKEDQQSLKQSLFKKHFKTGRACMMREELQNIYSQSKNRCEAETRLKKLCNWMIRSRLDPMKKCCKMIRKHWEDILNYFDKGFTNAILEGVNNIIQNIKCRARGYRNNNYFSTMIYLVLGELDIESLLIRP